MFKYWIELKLKPSNFNVFIICSDKSIAEFLDYVTQFTAIPTGTTANFRLHSKEYSEPLKPSPTFPSLQLRLKTSGQLTTPCIKFSINNVAVMTDCQYGGTT